MRVETRVTDTESISEFFQDLGLDDDKVREQFREFAKPSDWDSRRNWRLGPQYIQNGTAKEA